MFARAAAGVAVAAAVAATVAATGCTLPLLEAGRAPEGPVEERESASERARRARLEEERHARLDAADAAANSGQIPGDDAPGGRARTGSATTRRFHRAGCPELADVPAADRVPFATPFLALDHGYAPCVHCRPGP